MWSCAVIVATDWWKNLASLITTLVSPVKLTELGKNHPLTNQLTERRRLEVLCCDRRRLLALLSQVTSQEEEEDMGQTT